MCAAAGAGPQSDRCCESLPVLFLLFKSSSHHMWMILIQTREAILGKAGLRSELAGGRFSGSDPVQLSSASKQHLTQNTIITTDYRSAQTLMMVANLCRANSWKR